MGVRFRATLKILMVAYVTTAQLLYGVLSQDISCSENLASCFPFLDPKNGSPNQMCCDNLKRTVNNQSRCLCSLRTSELAKTVNITRAFELASECKVNFSIERCESSPPPASGPSAQKPKENHGNRLIGISGSIVFLWFFASLLM